MTADKKKKKSTGKDDSLLEWVKKAIDLIVHKQISETVILSSYKINSVLKNYFGVDIKVDRIGRALGRYARQKNLKRLSTNIPKYRLSVSEYMKENGEERGNSDGTERTADKNKRS